MAWVVVLVPLALLWNILMLSGMLAGQTTSVWRRRAAMGVQICLLAVGMFILVGLVPLAAKTETKGATKVAIYLASFFALGVGYLLTFVEYILSGRRRTFLSDLGNFSWFGR